MARYHLAPKAVLVPRHCRGGVSNAGRISYDPLTEHNPIERLRPLADAGIPLFHIHGNADAIVPLSQNSQVIFDRYTAMSGSMILKIVPGYGHVEAPVFFQDTSILNFILNDLTVAAEHPKTRQPVTVPRAARKGTYDVLGRPISGNAAPQEVIKDNKKRMILPR
ncbi:MAG: hypothetical protein V1913_13080 [Fibrobacterota bacterium]